MEILRVGLIGLGRFSEFHLQILKSLDNVQITAICDNNQDRLAIVNTKLNVNTYTDWKKMIEDEKLDVVHILTPEHLHTEPVIASLQSGCHVFVEKPLTINSIEAIKISKIAEQSEKILFVGHVLRFDPRFIQIKQQIDKGNFGGIHSIYARRNNQHIFFDIYKRTHPIFILGIHDIDLMRWFVNSDVIEVYTRETFDDNGNVLCVISTLTFENGTIGIIENNWLLPKKSPAFMDIRMEIVGDHSVVNIQEPDQSLVLWNNNEVSTPSFLSGNYIYKRYSGPLYEELLYFYQCIFNNEKPEIITIDDTVQAVIVAEAIAKSGKLRKPVIFGSS